MYQGADKTNEMGLLKCYPDKRRPLVKVYGVTAKGRPSFVIKWKDLSTGKWLMRTRRKRSAAEEVALAVVQKLTRSDTDSGLLTATDKERLQLSKMIPLDRLRRLAEECSKVSRRITVAEWYEIFADISSTRSISTRKEVRYRGEMIVRSFGDRFLDSLTHDDIESWYRERLNAGAPRSANNDLDMFRRMLNRAKERAFLPEGPTPADRVRKVIVPSGNVEILDIETAEKFITYLPVNERVRTFILIGMFAGLRPSEMEGVIGERNGLQWGDVDFENGYIHVRAEVGGKKTGERFVELMPVLVKLLLPCRKANGSVCLKKAHEEASKHYRDLGIIAEWSPDVMRHSYCSYLLAKTQDIGFVADQAGNSPGVIKKNYRRPLPKSKGKEYFTLKPRPEGGNIIAIA